MHITCSYTALELAQLIVQGTTDLCVHSAKISMDAEAVRLSRSKIVNIVERKIIIISVKNALHTLLKITRVSRKCSLPYSLLLE